MGEGAATGEGAHWRADRPSVPAHLAIHEVPVVRQGMCPGTFGAQPRPCRHPILITQEGMDPERASRAPRTQPELP